MKVLIVDDDEDVRNILTHAISKEDFTVKTASSVADALSDLAWETFDIVLTDLSIDPGAGGLELTAAINEKYPEIDVIMLTGYPTAEAAIKALKLGVYDYLSKPMEIRLVKAALRRCKEMRLMRARLARSEGTMGEAATLADAASRRIADLHAQVGALDFGAEHETCHDFAGKLLHELDHTLKDLRRALPRPI